MTGAPDLNDTLRQHGSDALRARIEASARIYRPQKIDEATATNNAARQKIVRQSISADDVKLNLAGDYFLKGWLYRGEFITIFGAPGCGKSLFAACLFYLIARGTENLFGKRVRKAVVLYVVLEGERGFLNRIVGLRERYGPCQDFHIDTFGSLNLANQDDIESLCEAAGRINADIIVVDTYAQATAGIAEGTSDEQQALSGINHLRRTTGAAVVVIDHTGWGEGEAQKRTRGWSGKYAATDVALHVDGDVKKGDVSVVPRRLKDGFGFDPIVFGSERVLLGVDADGDEVATFVAVERDARTATVRVDQSKRPKSEARSLIVFRAAFGEAEARHGFRHRVMGDGPIVRAVRMDHVREQYDRRYPSGEGGPKKQADATRQALKRALEKLAPEFPSERLSDGTEILWRLSSASTTTLGHCGQIGHSGQCPDVPGHDAGGHFGQDGHPLT